MAFLKRGTHVEGVSVDDEGLVLLVGEELRRVADVYGRLLLVARQHLWSVSHQLDQIGTAEQQKNGND